MFVSEQDAALAAFLGNLSNAQVSVAGPELVLGAIFDKIGFGQVVGEEMFRHLVISRLVYPGSKLKMIDYLQRYQGVSLSVDSVYRFLDKLNEQYKEVVEVRAFEHTKTLTFTNLRNARSLCVSDLDGNGTQDFVFADFDLARVVGWYANDDNLVTTWGWPYLKSLSQSVMKTRPPAGSAGPGRGRPLPPGSAA